MYAKWVIIENLILLLRKNVCVSVWDIDFVRVTFLRFHFVSNYKNSG